MIKIVSKESDYEVDIHVFGGYVWMSQPSIEETVKALFKKAEIEVPQFTVEPGIDFHYYQEMDWVESTFKFSTHVILTGLSLNIFQNYYQWLRDVYCMMEGILHFPKYRALITLIQQYSPVELEIRDDCLWNLTKVGEWLGGDVINWYIDNIENDKTRSHLSETNQYALVRSKTFLDSGCNGTITLWGETMLLNVLIQTQASDSMKYELQKLTEKAYEAIGIEIEP